MSSILANLTNYVSRLRFVDVGAYVPSARCRYRPYYVVGKLIFSLAKCTYILMK